VFVDRSIHVLVQLDEADADHLVVQLDVQGMPLGRAKLSRAGVNDFERLLHLALCLVDHGLPEPLTMTRPIRLAISVEHDQGDEYCMSFCLQGKQFGPATIAKSAVEDLELLVGQGILLVAGQRGVLACA
jgi:hypothetical protein